MTTQTIQEIHKLYKLSLEMADLAEEILESRGEYSNEFVQGLYKSFKEKRSGRVKKIQSLADLS